VDSPMTVLTVHSVAEAWTAHDDTIGVGHLGSFL